MELMSIQELYKIYLQHPVIGTDTRKITSGCLFFALKGDHFDANNFAAQALKDGAAYAIVDDPKVVNNDRFILVKNVMGTLQELATFHRQQLNIPVIGLTGTNGKTTTKELVKAVLSQKFNTSATFGNLNNHIGVPLTLLAIEPDVEVAIIEMGANHQKEIAMLSEIAKPDYGLITNVGKAHLEGFGGFEGVKKGKGELYTFLEKTGGTVFINDDNQHLKEMANNHTFKEVIYYGMSDSGLISGKLLANDPYLEVEWANHTAAYQVKTNLTGIYNFENILSAIAIGIKFGLNPDEINTGISTYQPQNNRSQIIKTNANTIIGDFYNANPSSMLVAIENIARLEANAKTLILGDMFELGEESPLEHKLIIEKALSFNFDQVIFIGEEFYKFNKEHEAQFFKTPGELKSLFKTHSIQDHLILLKGSRGMKLETLLEDL
jgi:UDP-N-acetylmuramoyl-tripeptide--D-alanyl-D-alanine ligase